MTTVFGQLEREFYNAIFTLDDKKRHIAIERWIEKTVHIIQSSVNTELMDFLETIIGLGSSSEEWDKREQKIRGIESEYHLVLEIKLRRISPGEKYHGTLPEPGVRPNMGKYVSSQQNNPLPVMKKHEIDLHGMNVENAILHVNTFLKDCHNTNEHEVLIIHGKGTGALREAVRKHIAHHPLVERIADADKNQGGAGAIRVFFKNK
jgi:hypothetical protein